jgi:N-acetylmuramoyl-L-alanine amidase
VHLHRDHSNDPERAAAQRIKGRIVAGLARDNLHGHAPPPASSEGTTRHRRGRTRWFIGSAVALLVGLVGRTYLLPGDAPDSPPGEPPRRLIVPPAMALPAPPTAADGEQFLLRERQIPLARLFQLGVQHIVLDPGHGGRDPGAVGPRTGIQEKEITLDICLQAAAELRARNDRLQVDLTRAEDLSVPLRERARFANELGADLFISVHINSFAGADYGGIETYHLGFPSDPAAEAAASRENVGGSARIGEFEALIARLGATLKEEESARLADLLQQRLYRGMRPLRGPEIGDYGVHRAPFLVLLDSEMPSVLAEVSLINDPAEEVRLTQETHRGEIAHQLVLGIEDYIAEIDSELRAALSGRS